MADGGQPLQLDELLLALDLDLFGAPHLRFVLRFQFIDAILEALYVGVVIDVEVRRDMS